MLKQYEELNSDSAKYFISIITDMKMSQKEYERCLIEINLLNDTGTLFIIKLLYMFKQDNKEVSFLFKGMINNLLVLYKLGLNGVDPNKYNLPYELYNDESISFEIINGFVSDLIHYATKNEFNYYLIKNYNIQNNATSYLVLPSYCNDDKLLLKFNDDILELSHDNKNVEEKYLIINIGEKYPFINSNFDLQLKTVTKKIRLIQKNMIQNSFTYREDIYNYLLMHDIDKQKCIEIYNFITKAIKNEIKWHEYVTLMEEHKCSSECINMFKNIKFKLGKGEIINEYLFMLDKENYIIYEN